MNTEKIINKMFSNENAYIELKVKECLKDKNNIKIKKELEEAYSLDSMLGIINNDYLPIRILLLRTVPGARALDQVSCPFFSLPQYGHMSASSLLFMQRRHILSISEYSITAKSLYFNGYHHGLTIALINPHIYSHKYCVSDS